MSTCNRLDLQTLGSQPVMPKNLPDHCSECCFSKFFCLLEIQQKIDLQVVVTWVKQMTAQAGSNFQFTDR